MCLITKMTEVDEFEQYRIMDTESLHKDSVDLNRPE